METVSIKSGNCDQCFYSALCLMNSSCKGVAHRASSLRNISHATQPIYYHLIYLNMTLLQLFSCELCKKKIRTAFYRTPGKSLIL